MLALVCLLVGTVFAGAQLPFYMGNDDVVKLTDADSFRRHVERATRPVIVEFYSPGCGHCVALKDTWARLAKSLAGHATVAAVNCQQSPLCSRFGVRGVPAIKLFAPAAETPGAKASRRTARVLGTKGSGPKQKADAAKTPVEFNEARTFEAISAFVKRHYPDRVTRVASDSAAAEVVAAPGVRAIVLKRGSAAPSFAVRSLAVHFGDEVRMYTADAASSAGAALLKALGVALPASEGDSPGFLVTVADGEPASLYGGVFAFTPIKEHLNALLDARVRPARPASEHVEL